MNRKGLIKAAMAVCAVIVVLSVAISVSGLFKGSTLEYADAEKYTAGEAVIGDAVHSLDISWVSGMVTVKYHSGNTVELREASKKAISEDMKLRWWLDGGTLRVRYAKKGFRTDWNLEKELTVMVPEGTVFNEVSISTASGNITVPALKAEDLIVNTVSGSIHASAEAKRFSAVTTSGDQVLRMMGAAERVSAASTSGRISLEADDVEEISASAVSGSIQVKAERVSKCSLVSTSGAVNAELTETDETKITSTSGQITFAAGRFAVLKAGTTSGSITAELPELPGFTAQIKTTSGTIDHEMAFSRKDGRYVCGDGSARAEIESTSGDIHLKTYDK